MAKTKRRDYHYPNGSDFENVLHGSDVGAMFFGPDIRLRRMTPNFPENNFLPADSLGKFPEEIDFTKDYRTFAQDVRKVDSTKQEIVREFSHNRKYWVITFRPYHNFENQPEGVTVVAFDITAQKQAEFASLSLMKNMSVAVAEVMYNGYNMDLMYTTDTVYQMFGYTRDEFKKGMKQKRRMLYLQEVDRQVRAIADTLYKEDADIVSRCRIRKKTGEIMWLEIRADVILRTEINVMIQYTLIDVTESHNVEEKLRQEQRRLAYVVEMAADVIFDYDIATDTILFTKQEGDEETSETRTENYLAGLKEPGVVFVDDLEVVDHFIDEMRCGAQNIKATFRRIQKDRKYHWYTMEGKTIYSTDGIPVNVIGRICNVDEEKAKEAELTRNSERDSLTGLYNHNVCIEKIKKQMHSLKGDETGYLVVLDVDDFKRINDENGHLFGDAVLCTISDEIRSLFPKATAGRIGGDEFMFFVRGMEATDMKQRLVRLNKNFVKLNSEAAHALSCSMGVAVCNAENKQYEDAFKTADQALYLVKKTGKNSFTLCDCGEFALEDGPRYLEEKLAKDDYSSQNRLITNDDEMMLFAMELLSNTSDFRSAIGLLADRIVKYIGIDEIIYFTSTADAYNLTFHWSEKREHPFTKRMYPKIQLKGWMNMEKKMEDVEEYLVADEAMLEEAGTEEAKTAFIIKYAARGEESHFMAYIDKMSSRSFKSETSILTRLSHLIMNKMQQMELDEKNREEIAYRTNFDMLTGLPSYTRFLDLASDYLLVNLMNPEKEYYIAYGDFLNFNYVNEIYGYTTGDRILELTGRRLERSNRHCVLVSRVTADQFVALIENEVGQNPLKYIPESFAQFNDVVKMKYPLCNLTVVCGLCRVENANFNIASLVDRANAARKHGKEQGESGCVLYTKEMMERNEEEKNVYANMVNALKNHEFVVYLQPKVSLKTGKIVGAEALVRWLKPDGTIVPPDKFIPVLEKNGFVTKVDYYVLEETLRFLKDLIEEEIAPIPISVNFSRVHYDDEHFAGTVMEYIEEYEMDPGLIEAEITEYIYLHDIKSMNPAIVELQRQGVLVSIDDFGSGYSSLNVLSKVTADIIKLDRMFLQDYESQTEFLSLLAAMIHKLGYQIVVEGVETKDQMEFLATTECDMVQGYYVARPMPMENFKKFLVEYNKTAEPWQK